MVSSKEQYIIYKAISPSGKIYIGLTSKELHIRINGHKRTSNTNAKTYFHKAIKKYGIINFKWKIIERNEDLNIAKKNEKYYIKLYKSNIEGYNLTQGGDGVCGYKFSDEDKKYISMKTREAMKNPIIRQKCKSNLGKPSAKRIKIIDNNGIIYDSITEASKILKVTSGAIKYCIKNKVRLKNTLSFKKYEDGDTVCPAYAKRISSKKNIPMQLEQKIKLQNHSRNKSIISDNGQIFKSISEASRITGMFRQKIQKLLKTNKQFYFLEK